MDLAEVHIKTTFENCKRRCGLDKECGAYEHNASGDQCVTWAFDNSPFKGNGYKKNGKTCNIKDKATKPAPEPPVVKAPRAAIGDYEFETGFCVREIDG